MFTHFIIIYLNLLLLNIIFKIFLIEVDSKKIKTCYNHERNRRKTVMHL